MEGFDTLLTCIFQNELSYYSTVSASVVLTRTRRPFIS
jgi:hypothetical protein